MNLYKYASPATFYPLAGKMIPWFAIPATLLFATGMFVGFFIAPPDFQQGEAYRIIFIHVPAAWMGMLLYVLMAIYAGIGWTFNARLSSMMASAIAVTGAMFTALSLITGAFWGKPKIRVGRIAQVRCWRSSASSIFRSSISRSSGGTPSTRAQPFVYFRNQRSGVRCWRHC
jgi:ABC-type transport system involved in cytochrome c biogenesis permease subunit